MKYLDDKFTLPANSKRGITDCEWEIATGSRCVKCKKLTEKCHCKK